MADDAQEEKSNRMFVIFPIIAVIVAVAVVWYLDYAKIIDLATIIPADILGVPLLPLIGLIIGILLACYEGIGVKFKKYKLKINDQTVKFNKLYCVSGIIAILIVCATIWALHETNQLIDLTENTVATAVKAGSIGFVEGMVTIRAINTRIDNFLISASLKAGASAEEAQKIANSVEVVVEEDVADPVIEEVTTTPVKEDPLAFVEKVEEEERTDLPKTEKINLKSL